MSYSPLLLIENNFGGGGDLQKNDRKEARDLRDLPIEPSCYTDKKAETKRGKRMIQDNKGCLFLSNISWQAVDQKG